MNWPVILNVAAVVLGGIASAFAYYKKNQTAFVVGLCVVAINGVLIFVKTKEYSNKVPAVTATNFYGPMVKITVTNVDDKLPLKDVSAKVQGFRMVQLGTMPPGVRSDVQDLSITNNTIIVVSVWYNETERMEADFDIKMKPDSTLTIETTYLDAKGVPFVPEWKQKALKSGPDTTSHYNPTLFK